MSSKLTLALVLCLFVCVCGCETAKGFTKGLKQDLHNTWENMKGFDKKFKETWW